MIGSVVDEGLGNSAYVVDLGDGGALVVDPLRDPSRHLTDMERRGLHPRFVAETHLHADFVSGARELAARCADVLAPRHSGLAFAHRSLEDGDELDLGGLRLRAIATPGHTPEHLAYLLLDGSEPVALFSGGTLIAGGVARTDLLRPDQTEPLARAAYRSLHERLLVLPDDLPVHPTHGPGSFCSTGPAGERTTTIGRERATNPLLDPALDEDAFVARLLAGFGTFPPYFLELREVNRRGPAVYGPSAPTLAQLDVSEVEAAVTDGAELVDVRPMGDFAAGHVPGSLSIPWREAFATWLGWLVDRGRPVALVADDSVPRQRLVWACRNIGFDDVLGELAGGLPAWVEAGRPVATTPLVSAGEAQGRRVVDVRQRSEHETEHVVDALHVELGAVEDHAHALLDEPLLVHCAHGERAMSAASILERAGHRDVAVLAGGPADLAAAGRVGVDGP